MNGDGGPSRADDEWLDHCKAREVAERAAAKNATSIRAHAIHQELAQAYARIIQRAGGSRAQEDHVAFCAETKRLCPK